MSQQKIIDFLASLPTREKIEKEIGLSQGFLSDRRYKWRKTTIKKIEKVLKKYGYESK